VCHTSSSPKASDLNTLGTASKTCTSTTCGATVNPFCVATAPRNPSITAPAANTNVALGQSLTFTGATASNPDGFALTYRWAFSNGQPTATGQNSAVPMTIAGPVTATLTVLNSVGMVATGTAPTRAVTVTGAPTGNQAPTASINAPAAANTSVAPGASMNFQGSGTDPDNNTPLTYAWSFPGGNPASSTAQNPGAVTYSTAGVFTATLIVKDSLGLASAAVTRTVTVAAPGANQPPVASIAAPTASPTVAPGAAVNFQGAGTDPDNNVPLSYKWSFPGGNPASSSVQNPGAVSYAAAGTYTASLTVTDGKGLASVPATLSVTVAAVSQKLAASIDAPCINV
jgi:PKD repeat protein